MHIYNRGVNREQIFFTDSSYQFFIDLLAKSLMRDVLSIHSYCLMPNHFHLTIRQEDPYAVSVFMKRVCEPYAKAVNKLLHRHGHLFEERFQAKHISDPSQLLQVSRYIHLNPVTAKMVDSPLSWEYSSCAEYYGRRESAYLTTDITLSLVGGPEDYARYLRKCRDGYSEEVVKCLIDWEKPGL